MSNLLGIDLGTSSIKVVITNQKGMVLSRGSSNYPMLFSKPGWVEQDPEHWWRATRLAIQAALVELEVKQEISSIGLSGQMHGTVLLDGNNSLLYPAIIWPDQRSSLQVDEITNLIGSEQLIEITGSKVATGFQAASLRWMQQNNEQQWTKTRHVLLPKDYLRWRLCGGFASDPSDAAGTGLLDGNSRNWSQEILALLLLDANLLPPVYPSTTKAGAVIRAAAEDTGLPADIPVIIGAADTAASLLGAGIIEGRDLLVTISTGGQLITPTSRYIFDRQGQLHTFCSAVEPGGEAAGWYLMGATLSAGQSLRWLRDNVLKIKSHDAYPEMIALAEGSVIGADGLFFTPYLSGDRSAADESQVRGAFCGLTIQHGRAELIRAVLEGVVFSLYEKFLVLVENGLHPERIILAGGGARSRLWTQIVANVFGLPVERVLVEEQSAYGAAILAGAGAGMFDIPDGARMWRKLLDPVEPDIKAHTHYKDLFSIFRLLYQSTNRSSSWV